jgi:hypothetical protein
MTLVEAMQDFVVFAHDPTPDQIDRITVTQQEFAKDVDAVPGILGMADSMTLAIVEAFATMHGKKPLPHEFARSLFLHAFSLGISIGVRMERTETGVQV